MAKAYTAQGGFKRVEASLRTATNGFRDVLSEIDKALAGKRTDAEVAFLKSMREQVVALHEQSRAAVGKYISNVPL